MPERISNRFRTKDEVARDEHVACDARDELLHRDVRMWIWRPRAGHLQAKRDALASLDGQLSGEKIAYGEWEHALYIAGDPASLEAAKGSLHNRGLFPGDWSAGKLPPVIDGERSATSDGGSPAPNHANSELPGWATALLIVVMFVGMGCFCVLAFRLLPARPGIDNTLKVGLYRWTGSLGGSSLPADSYHLSYFEGIRKLREAAPEQCDIIALPFADAEALFDQSGDPGWELIAMPEHTTAAEKILIYKDLAPGSQVAPHRAAVEAYYDEDRESALSVDQYLHKYWKSSTIHKNRLPPDQVYQELTNAANEQKIETAVVATHDPYAQMLQTGESGRFVRVPVATSAPSSTVLLARTETLKERPQDVARLIHDWSIKLVTARDLRDDPVENILNETGELFRPGKPSQQTLNEFINETEPTDVLSQAALLYGFKESPCARQTTGICAHIEPGPFERQLPVNGVALSDSQKQNLCESDRGVENRDLAVAARFPRGGHEWKSLSAQDLRQVKEWSAGWPGNPSAGYFCVIGETDKTAGENYELGLLRAEQIVSYLRTLKPSSCCLIEASKDIRDADTIPADNDGEQQRRVVIRRPRMEIAP